jgi:hypothetical protein
MRLLAHPELRRPGPPPLRVDLRRVLLAGMGAWVVALVAFGVLYLTGRAGEEAVLICAVGLVLGVAGLVWERGHRKQYRGED